MRRTITLVLLVLVLGVFGTACGDETKMTAAELRQYMIDSTAELGTPRSVLEGIACEEDPNPDWDYRCTWAHSVYHIRVDGDGVTARWAE